MCGGGGGLADITPPHLLPSAGGLTDQPRMRALLCTTCKAQSANNLGKMGCRTPVLPRSSDSNMSLTRYRENKRVSPFCSFVQYPRSCAQQWDAGPPLAGPTQATQSGNEACRGGGAHPRGGHAPDE